MVLGCSVFKGLGFRIFGPLGLAGCGVLGFQVLGVQGCDWVTGITRCICLRGSRALISF